MAFSVSRYANLAPARVLDTRAAPNNVGSCPTPGTCAPLAANSPIDVQVTGLAGVPSSRVTGW